MSTRFVCPHPLIPAFVENEYFFFELGLNYIPILPLFFSKADQSCLTNPGPAISCLWVFFGSFNPSVFEVHVLTFNRDTII